MLDDKIFIAIKGTLNPGTFKISYVKQMLLNCEIYDEMRQEAELILRN